MVHQANRVPKPYEVTAEEGLETYGILSNPFLLDAYHTTSFTITVTTHPDGTPNPLAIAAGLGPTAGT